MLASVIFSILCILPNLVSTKLSILKNVLSDFSTHMGIIVVINICLFFNVASLKNGNGHRTPKCPQIHTQY